MKLNKYLKELGLKWEDLPGNYSSTADPNSPAADHRNIEDEEGFCEREFFSLDHTLDLIIYSKLSYFREHIAPKATPSYFTYCDDGTDPNQEWLNTLDEILLGFRLSILGMTENPKDRLAIENARYLFIHFYGYFWW